MFMEDEFYELQAIMYFSFVKKNNCNIVQQIWLQAKQAFPEVVVIYVVFHGPGVDVILVIQQIQSFGTALDALKYEAVLFSYYYRGLLLY